MLKSTCEAGGTGSEEGRNGVKNDEDDADVDEDGSLDSRSRAPASDQREAVDVEVLASSRCKSDLDRQL